MATRCSWLPTSSSVKVAEGCPPLPTRNRRQEKRQSPLAPCFSASFSPFPTRTKKNASKGAQLTPRPLYSRHALSQKRARTRGTPGRTIVGRHLRGRAVERLSAALAALGASHATAQKGPPNTGPAMRAWLRKRRYCVRPPASALLNNLR